MAATDIQQLLEQFVKENLSKLEPKGKNPTKTFEVVPVESSRSESSRSSKSSLACLGEDSETQSVSRDKSPGKPGSLQVMTKKDLDQYCRDNKIPGFSTKKKDDLVIHIRKTQIEREASQLDEAVTKQASSSEEATKSAKVVKTTKETSPGVKETTGKAGKETTGKTGKVVKTTKETSPDVKESGLMSMTKKDLDQYCRDNQIPGFSTKKKDDLVIHIKKVESEREGTPKVEKGSELRDESSPCRGVDLEVMKKTEVDQYCRDHKIPGFSTKKKAELIAHIHKVESERESSPGPVEVQKNSKGAAKETSLQAMKKEELVAYCKEHCIAKYSNKNKEDLLAHIRKTEEK